MTAKFTCLVIDDDPIAASIYRAVLASRPGVDVMTAPSGSVARRLFVEAAGQFDLILCDLSMHDGDGIDVIDFLARMQHRGCIALVSGQPVKIVRSAEQHAHDLGLNLLGSFGKPINPHDLLRLVDDLRDQAALADVFDITTLVSDAQIAVSVEEERIVPYFQPRVDLKTGKVIGVEALARFRHDQFGMLGPDAFLPGIKRLGMSSELFITMLLNSLVEVARWPTVQREFKIAVNLTAGDWGDHSLSELVEHALYTVGTPPSCLVLDVSGARTLFSMGQARRELTRLRLLGVSISISEFGSGAFPLVQLLDYPINELKISPSLTRRAVSSASAAVCVRSAIQFANENALHLVAMGIEAPEQADFMLSAGVGTGQGYWFGKPLPGDEVAPLLAWSANEALVERHWDQRMAVGGGG